MKNKEFNADKIIMETYLNASKASLSAALGTIVASVLVLIILVTKNFLLNTCVFGCPLNKIIGGFMIFFGTLMLVIQMIVIIIKSIKKSGN